MSDNNYYSTFIAVAPDSKTQSSKIPKSRGAKPTVAMLQFEMLHNNDFAFTQEDVLFNVWLQRKGPEEATQDEIALLRQEFFATPQPCLRASPLTKTHGWGIECNADGKIALRAIESDEYQRCLNDTTYIVTHALRSKRAT